MAESGTLHADDRIQHGFSGPAVLAEFRALRASVLKLYEKNGQTDLSEVRRFNEALDEALTASMNRFAMRTDLFRDQFIGVPCRIFRGALEVERYRRAALQPDPGDGHSVLTDFALVLTDFVNRHLQVRACHSHRSGGYTCSSVRPLIDAEKGRIPANAIVLSDVYDESEVAVRFETLSI